MCLAVPSRVISINNNMCVVEVDNVKREVSLMLIDDVNIGDYVIVHAGFAINRIDEAEALESLRILREAISLVDPDSIG